jgi:hypothetical protein
MSSKESNFEIGKAKSKARQKGLSEVISKGREELSKNRDSSKNYCLWSDEEK